MKGIGKGVKNFFTNVIIAMGLCHLLRVEMVIKKKKLMMNKNWRVKVPGVQ